MRPWLLVALVGCACGDIPLGAHHAPDAAPVEEPDASAAADGGPDGGADAGPTDAGPVDSGPRDAGPADSGPWWTQDSPVAYCPVASMEDLYPGLLPTNPYGSFPAAGACISAKHDAIMIFGCPNESDGRPAACQTARADIAVALWQSGLGDEFIVTGAAVHTPYVEADTLSDLLVARGAPAHHIWREARARHTDENIYYSTRIMEAHGWTNAIVVSEDAGQLAMTAVCDSNCCVELGRLTVLEFQVQSVTRKLGHYVRHPYTDTVPTAECTHIERSSKLMCTQLASRLACAENFQIEP